MCLLALQYSFSFINIRRLLLEVMEPVRFGVFVIDTEQKRKLSRLDDGFSAGKVLVINKWQIVFPHEHL